MIRQVGMGQGCESLLEPRYWGVHELMVRLLGRCTCASEARVHELYTVDGVRRDAERIGA